jgi:hypothetical protein
MYAVRVGLGACLAALACAANAPAVILTVIVDDLGWNNVGWHQNQTGPANATPRLTSLAKAGIILDRHYVHFTCTPSRSSYLSGRLPVHVQQTLANPDIQNSGIPRNMTALPAKLKEAGYATHVAVRRTGSGSIVYVCSHYDSCFDCRVNGTWGWPRSNTRRRVVGLTRRLFILNI